MNNTIYYNGKKMTAEQAETRRHINVKLKLNLPLTARERATYLLLIANDEQVKEFLRKEQERWKGKQVIKN